MVPEQMFAGQEQVCFRLQDGRKIPHPAWLEVQCENVAHIFGSTSKTRLWAPFAGTHNAGRKLRVYSAQYGLIRLEG